MTEMLIQCMCICQSFFIIRCPVAFEHGHLIEKILYSFSVSHRTTMNESRRKWLIEVVPEPLEDRAFGVAVTFEVVAVLELLNGFLLFAAQRLRYVNTDVYHQVTYTSTVSLYGR